MKYRKKPVVIEAVEIRDVISASGQQWSALPPWVKEAYEKGRLVITPNYLCIHTMEGILTGAIDDMLIKGVKGELYACKPDIFAATYDAV